jgi:multidrug efflux pump
MGAWLGHKAGQHWLTAGAMNRLNLPVPPEQFDLVRFAGPILIGAVAALLLALTLGRPINWLLARWFRAFNRSFDCAIGAYTRSVARLLKVSLIALAVYGGLLFLTYWGFTHTPTGFIPQQDKGYLLVNVQLPDAASSGRSRDVVKRIEELAHKTPGVKHTVAISGQSILLGTNAPNFGALYLMLDDFEDRRDPSRSAPAIAAALQEQFQREVPQANVSIFGAPPVEGLGTAGGIKLVMQDTGDNTPRELQRTADTIAATAEKDPKLQGLFTSFRSDTPWLELEIDRAQARDRGVSIDDVRSTLEATLGPYYVNDFNRFGRTWQVNVQALGDFRRTAEDVKRIKVRNSVGDMVPLADFAKVKSTSGPVMVTRYNMYPAAAVQAEAGEGTSSGQAIKRLQEIAEEERPQSMRATWTELALLQLQTGNTAMWVFLLAVVLVFLVLAAQYESWALPLAVILVVPMCLLCSIGGVLLSRSDVNIFTQIGFLVLVGLACKNAILIVEFAKARREDGVPRLKATLEACELRLRPIIMTSFAFIMGVVPLMVSEGAGAEMRRTLGTAVFSGMLGVTLFGIFLTPIFFYVIQWLKDRRPAPPPEEDTTDEADATESPVPVNGHVANGSHSKGLPV